MSIKSTTNYKNFRYIAWNRDVDRSKLKDLKKSMKLRNLTKDLPILVNGKFEVLDGQHRLEACKELGLPVYFHRVSEMTTHDIALIQKGTKWQPADYVKYWKVKGNRNFWLFDKFIRKFELPVSTGLAIIGKASGKKHHIQEGKLEFNESQFQDAVHVMNKVENFKDHFDNYKNRCFLTAISKIMALKQYDHKQMMSKLDYLKLRRCADTVSYIESIEEVYNHRTRTKVYFSELLRKGRV